MPVSTDRNSTTFLTHRGLAYWATVGYAVLLSAIVRILLMPAGNFSLNDGGMFYTMIRDLQAANFRLPAITHYNALNIPFAYPPLAFYLAAVLESLSHWDLLLILRYVPLVTSIVTILAFAALSRDLLRSPARSAVAVVAFALLPMSSRWYIMGGGLTRAPGMLFATLALLYAHRMYTGQRNRDVILTAVFAAATVLTHPEAAWFAAYSIALFFLIFGRSRAGIIRSLIVFAGTLLLTSSWWMTVSSHTGLATFLPVFASGSPLSSGIKDLLLLHLTMEGGFPLLAVLALLGLPVAFTHRQRFLPVWLLTIFLCQSRAASQKAIIPLALLAGIGFVDVVLPLLNRTASYIRGHASSTTDRPSGVRPVNGLAWELAIAGSLYIAFLTYATNLPYSVTLGQEERTAMTWISANTPQESWFLVITSDWWAWNYSAEWFPVFAERHSLNTLQGREWLADFPLRLREDYALQQCADQNAECVRGWAEETGTHYTHVYLPKRAPVQNPLEKSTCCGPLRESLTRDPQHQIIYDGPGGTVFALVATR